MASNCTASLRLNCAFIAALLLTGCATISPDGGRGAVQTLTSERLGPNFKLPPAKDETSMSVEVSALLSRPLAVDDAVQIALFNNAGLKASFAGLGIAEADLVQAGRLANPHFTFSSKRSSEVTTIDRMLMFNVMSLLTMPLARNVAGRQFETVQLALAIDVLQLAGDTRRAYFSAIAAKESVTYFEQVKTAAEASAELAERMARVGNFNKLTQMREQAFYADATAQLARAKVAAVAERERLTRLLGLAGTQIRFQLPERLPDLPAGVVEPVDAERAALERRLDVRMAKRASEATAANLGLTRATRFINVLEAGYVNESNTGERRQNGYEISVELPLFDWGDAKLARAEATYMGTIHRAAEVSVRAQSEVRETYENYRATYDVARHYRDEVVPLRKRIADENVLRYNGMQIGVFELLADAREQIGSVNNYIAALRDFWIAETDLQLALTGASPGTAPRPGPASMGTGSAGGGH